MDEYGYVIDVELAKAILIEFFSTGEYQYNKYDADYQEFYAKISSDLVDIGDGYSFIDPENGHSYFGGPEGASGYWIQEMSEWVEDAKRCHSVDGYLSDLNNENKIFYEVDGELKCFIIHESD